MTTQTNRRAWIAASLALATSGWMGQAVAQAYPTRPITLIVPYAAGGNGDFTARLFADSLGKAIGQAVVVDNRAGGGGAIGATYVETAKPDGYTLLVAAKGVFSITPNVVKTHYTMANFVPISFVSRTPMVLVTRKGSTIDSLETFIAKAKDEPGKMPVGIGAMGSDNHASYLMLERASSRRFNPIAYKGSGPMLQDLLGNQIEVAIDQLTSSKPYIESGDVMAIAVLGTSPEPSLPGVPTISKIGAEPFDSTTFIGLLAPKGVSPEVVRTLQAASKKALEDPKLGAGLAKVGGSIYAGEKGEFETRVTKESAFIQEMIASGKIAREQ